MYEHPGCQGAIIDISMICETDLGARYAYVHSI